MVWLVAGPNDPEKAASERGPLFLDIGGFSGVVMCAGAEAYLAKVVGWAVMEAGVIRCGGGGLLLTKTLDGASAPIR